jgi:capsular exopolysaccharide synthesis family protein
LQTEIAQIDKSIRTEESTTIKRAENDLASAKTGENSLRAALEAEKKSTFESSSKAVQYSLAVQEYQSDRALYQSLEARLEEAGILASLHSSTVRVIDLADPPDVPSSPRTHFNLAIGLLSGLGFGIFVATLHSLLDTNVKTISDVETKLGLPLLGLIPKSEARQVYPQEFIDAATSDTKGRWSHLVESYRALRTSVMMSRAGGPPQIIMVTSAEAGEGKSTASSLTAITLALNGARVLLLDADLRRPTQQSRFKTAGRLGLSSCLSGSTSVEECLYAVPSLPSLHVLAAGPVPPMPAELLGSQKMTDLLAECRKKYDFVILDTPPVLTVTDASVLSSASDGVLLILRYGKSKHNTINRCIETLLRSGGQILGAVVNAVDQKSVDYSAYYGDSYNSYYEPENKL